MKNLKLIIMSCLLLVMAALPVQADAASGTLRMAVTDIEGLEMLQREFGAFKNVLSAKLGMDVEFYPVPNRTALSKPSNPRTWTSS